MSLGSGAICWLLLLYRREKSVSINLLVSACGTFPCIAYKPSCHTEGKTRLSKKHLVYLKCRNTSRQGRSCTRLLNGREKRLQPKNTPTETLRHPLTGLTCCHHFKRTHQSFFYFLLGALSPPCVVFDLCPPPPCQVLLTVDLMGEDEEESQARRRWEPPALANPQLLRGLVPVAYATCQDTPGSPVPSGDRSFMTICRVI